MSVIMRKKTLLATLLVSQAAFLPSGIAQVDQESRFYEIYREYHAKPTDQKAWNKLLEPLTTESYKIQPGDNLWNISELFFGDGNYWPKVWSVNSRIENPHLIEPGNEIRFRLGSSDSAPSFFITEQSSNSGETMADALPTLVSTGGSQELPGIEVPPPLVQPKPVLQKFPVSLPFWGYNNISPGREVNDWDLEIVPRKILTVQDQALLQSFVAEEPVQFLGEVVEPQIDDEIMVHGKTVYVRLDSNRVQPGDVLLVVHDAGGLNYREERNARNGRVLRIAAQITLREPIEVRRPKYGSTYYRARIDRSLDLTTRGLRLISGRMKRIDFSKAGRVSNLPIRVLGGQLDNRGFHFSTGNVVYIDKGSSSGVSEGDIFMIQNRKSQEFREPKPLMEFTQVQVGQVQVVDVRDHFATAVVLGGSERITPGDGSFN